MTDRPNPESRAGRVTAVREIDHYTLTAAPVGYVEVTISSPGIETTLTASARDDWRVGEHVVVSIERAAR